MSNSHFRTSLEFLYRRPSSSWRLSFTCCERAPGHQPSALPRNNERQFEREQTVPKSADCRQHLLLYLRTGRSEDSHGQSTMKKQEARTHKEAPLARKDTSNWQRKSYEPIDDSDAGDIIQVCTERNRLTLGSAAAAAAPNDCLIGCTCN